MWVLNSTREPGKLNHPETVYSQTACHRQADIARLTSQTLFAANPEATLPLLSMIRQAQLSIDDLLGQLSRQVIGKIDVARNPIQLYATSDGKTLYVANQGTENVAPPASEDEHVTGAQILNQRSLRQRGQAIEAFAHVGQLRCHPHPRARG